jgi:hypothetical protein
MSNAEQGIAQAQTEAAKGRLAKTEGLQKQQKWNIAYLDERIFIYFGAIAFVGLLVVSGASSGSGGRGRRRRRLCRHRNRINLLLNPA